jgi:hypothetical protein
VFMTGMQLKDETCFFAQSRLLFLLLEVPLTSVENWKNLKKLTYLCPDLGKINARDSMREPSHPLWWLYWVLTNLIGGEVPGSGQGGYACCQALVTEVSCLVQAYALCDDHM